jgi:hypothetical protein
MPLDPELTKLLNEPYINYSPQTGPETKAGDCRWWLHQFYKTRFGIILPTGMWSQEIYTDEQIFQTVLDTSRFFEGDIFMFGPNHNSSLDARRLHMTYFTGEVDNTNNPLLLHATQYETKVVIWPLPFFSTKTRYEKLERVKRLKPEFWEPLVKPVIL